MNNQPRRIYDFGSFRLDPKERLLLREGEPIPLPPKVFDTLLALVENSGQLIEKDDLLEKVWADAIVEEHGLAQNIFLLRKVLGESSEGKQYIETVPKRGYRFVAAVKQTQDGDADLILQKRTRLRATVAEEVSEEEYRSEETAHPQLEQRSRRLASYLINKRVLAVAGVVVVVFLVAVIAWWIRQHQSRPRIAFEQRDWVLITSFDNRTGESLFDGTLEYALERELSNSQFVNVAPPERVEDALRLMKKPLDTKIDAQLGREVCLRDGGIRALLAGRAEKLGSTYVLGVSLIDAATNQIVATISEEAASQEQVAAAVRQLSNWARESLGEALVSIRQSNQELEKVTTPSLRALQLYTQGEALLRQEKWPVAEQLYRQALAEDPEFASAYMMLAWAIHNQKKPGDEWKALSDRALELSERTSERERYFIQGSYYSISNQVQMAVPIYEALLQRYPDHYWGINNLVRAYYRLRRFHDVLPHLIKRADLRPNDFEVQADLVSTASTCRQVDVALRYARHANELISPETTSRYIYKAAGIQYFISYEPYLRGDLGATLTELERLTQTIDVRSGEERDAYATFAGMSYLGFGRLKAAEEFARKVSADSYRHYDLALIALTRDDTDSLKKNLLEYLNRSRFRSSRFTVPLLTRAGMFAEAQKLISNPAWKDEGFVKISQGEMALAQGRTAQAILLLEQGVKSMQSAIDTIFLYPGSESLAAAYEREGDLSSALRVLEEAARGDEISNPPRVFWLRVKAQLARLYRKLGRVEDAQKVEAELLRLLAYADEDHPILRQLRNPQSSNQSPN
jgi:DNA-binding winged helix-turn-helix (wHTH) protein/tetratricopeptide (TPR) repeat protein